MTATAVPARSLVIPAYNEENRITLFFDSITRFEGEMIVVCDGTDRTAAIVESVASRRTDLSIRCLRFDHRLGKGGGVIAGLQVARAPFVGYVDADGSTSIEEMLRLFASLPAADGAIGSRWVAGSNLTVKQGFLRQMESRCFNLLIRLLFGLSYNDTQCGAKVFTKKAVDEVLSQMVSTGFEFDVELLWRMKKAGFCVEEIPIEWQNKGDSRVQKRDMIRMLSGLFTIRFGKGRV
jgi:glycosyltransferase involved in cell wall biosynthesis